MIDLSVIILSGGNAKRFKSDKTIALLHGKPLYMYGLEYGLKVSDNIIHISKNKDKYKPFHKNILYYEDDLEEVCPMSGLIKAGNVAKYNNICVISADSPMVNDKLILYMYNQLKDYDGVVPIFNNKHYPLIAVYKKYVLNSMVDDYNNKNYKLIKSIEKYNIKYLEENEILQAGFNKNIFININYKEDLKLLEDI